MAFDDMTLLSYEKTLARQFYTFMHFVNTFLMFKVFYFGVLNFYFILINPPSIRYCD